MYICLYLLSRCVCEYRKQSGLLVAACFSHQSSLPALLHSPSLCTSTNPPPLTSLTSPSSSLIGLSAGLIALNFITNKLNLPIR
ncbi:hypothetical protein CDL15_Pgr005428 [Punica granatum]|uniref:Uncharacterized protein n=1 Tax=Punica granatum TaxID=22663 RepID=A0A218WUD8_PUNGR|nr:hypothetical protein CDL15_Pgr005428 [Punica granatum]